MTCETKCKAFRKSKSRCVTVGGRVAMALNIASGLSKIGPSHSSDTGGYVSFCDCVASHSTISSHTSRCRKLTLDELDGGNSDDGRHGADVGTIAKDASKGNFRFAPIIERTDGRCLGATIGCWIKQRLRGAPVTDRGEKDVLVLDGAPPMIVVLILS
jgi:hypothetical protein